MIVPNMEVQQMSNYSHHQQQQPIFSTTEERPSPISSVSHNQGTLQSNSS